MQLKCLFINKNGLWQGQLSVPGWGQPGLCVIQGGIGGSDQNSLVIGAFQLAIEAASRGRRVWFISVKPLEKVPPEIEPPCKQILQLITFIYLSDFARLMRHLNGIHKWKHLPSVVVVKGFDAYCDQSGCGLSSRGAAFLMATLLDCLRFLGKKQACSSVLVISCSKSALSQAAPADSVKVLVDMYLDFFFPPVEDSAGLLERIKALDLLN
uniref:Uncharacterized protein n=1 Tax=Dendroctonus ponderosae TaxID=77166 RepID=A0AAR5PZS4_DENPD